MKARVLVVIAGLVAATLLTPVAQADAVVVYPAPVITSPTEGASVTGTATVTVTSTAPYLLVRASTGSPFSVQFVESVVPVIGGTATWAWPTFGFGDGAFLESYACQDANQDTCGGDPSAKVTVNANNTVDGFSAPTTPVFHAPALDPPLTVTVTDDNPGGTMYVAHVIGVGTSIWEGPITPNQPTTLSFTDPVYDVGSHTGQR
jgi:hypothetical protein